MGIYTDRKTTAGSQQAAGGQCIHLSVKLAPDVLAPTFPLASVCEVER